MFTPAYLPGVHSMSRISLLAALSLTAGLVFNPAMADETKPQMIKGWGTVVDPDGDCKVSEENGKLTIAVPKTYHDLTHFEGQTKLNAPRILQKVKGDFCIQVKVNVFPLPAEDTSSSGKFSFVSAGLIVWHDTNNFIRIERAAESGRPFVWIEHFENGKATTQKLEVIADNTTYLRFTKSGTKLTYETSQDGSTWQQIEAEDAMLTESVDVGVLAINTTTRNFAPQLEGLIVTAK
jgi:regulation of enolase protein 1 (concanavalin A-like superfamily)